jgi:hypothetical protein
VKTVLHDEHVVTFGNCRPVVRGQAGARAPTIVSSSFDVGQPSSLWFLPRSPSGAQPPQPHRARARGQPHSHTPNDNAADGITPHLLPTLHDVSCVCLLHVRCPGHVHSAVLEGLYNNTPHVMVIDEIGRSEEVEAVRA